MDDFLLELSQNATAKKVIKQLGLPVPMPQALERDREPTAPRPMRGKRVAMHGSPDSELLRPVAQALLGAGATVLAPPHVAEVENLRAEADGLEGTLVEHEVATGEAREAFDGLVFDASTCEGPAELERLYEFFHPRLRSMNRCGKVVVLSRPPEAGEVAATSAAQRGVEGFTRSLARELGRFGSTANLLVVEHGAEDQIERPLLYLSTARSAYVSAQPLRVRADRRPHPDAVRERRLLKGKTALVTGAAGGIGRATVVRMAEEGATVLAVDLPGSGRLDDLEYEVGAVPVPLDLTEEEAPDAIAELADEHDGLDIVVHNAGITRDRTLANMTRESWDQAVAVNLEAPVRVTDRLIAEDLIAEWGRVLCLSSVAGIAGNVGQTNYAATKAGLIGLVQKLAELLADRQITANAVAPGFIETRMTEEMPVVIREVARRMNALSQGGQPGDVANALTFLASPGAQAVDGEVLRVCGGAMTGA